MAFREEAEAAISAEAARKPTDTIGWGSIIERAGQSPNVKVTIDNDDGFLRVFLVPESEGLTNDDIKKLFLHDTINEIRRRRRGK